MTVRFEGRSRIFGRSMEHILRQFLVPIILKWLLDFWNLCGPLT